MGRLRVVSICVSVDSIEKEEVRLLSSSLFLHNPIQRRSLSNRTILYLVGQTVRSDRENSFSLISIIGKGLSLGVR